MLIYADNAATTKISPAAADEMVHCMKQFWGNPSSLHTPGQKAAEKLAECRAEIAQIMGCLPKEIYFTGGGSESDNQAILSAAYAGAKKGKKHIVTTAFEHHAVLHTLRKLEKERFSVTYLPVGPDGVISAEQVAEALTEETALVTVMYANNEIGTIQPIMEIGGICREKKVLFHCDAVQAVGHMAMNVEELQADYLTASAHKFNGPRGCGFLYAKWGTPLSNLIEGGAQERGKRGGTENLAAIAGMTAALKENISCLEENAKKTAKLRDLLIGGLSEIPHSRLNGSREIRLPGIVNFCFEGIEGESLLLLLDEKGIAASSGSACTSGSLDPSHVLLALGLPHEVAHGSLRLSVNEENTEEEMQYIVDSVKEVVSYLREMSPVWEELEKGIRKFLL
ncbi:MAG: cysteine desulfurase [Eubacterium sp.]|nr:cysteine desulfurase [Eubacterium sp.]